MRSEVKRQWVIWSYYFLSWFITMAICVPIIELVVGPVLRSWLYNIPYQLPTWDRMGRMAIFVVVFSLFVGTLLWAYEFYMQKKSSR
jgi:hypothetical protein